MTVFSGFGVAHALRALFLASTLFAASKATATEEGLISLTLADEAFDLPLSTGHSDWTSSQGFVQVSILARPPDMATWARFQSLRLAFDLLQNRAQFPELSLLRRTDDAEFERWYGRRDSGDLKVILTDTFLDGDLLRISGSFDGALGQSRDFGRTIDMSSPMPVTGLFEVTLLPIR